MRVNHEASFSALVTKLIENMLSEIQNSLTRREVEVKLELNFQPTHYLFTRKYVQKGVSLPALPKFV